MMNANTQAVLLLTAYFDKAGNTSVSPLTNKEWGRFALWLRDKNLTPESLISNSVSELLAGLNDKKITAARIEALLNRGAAMALAVEKWQRSGIWVITRSESDYPMRLKKHLKNDAPPVLFGCGNRSLLNQGGLAVIGSRNTSESDLEFSRELGVKAAYGGGSIVSGGARGVDEAAMLGSLEVEGSVIGILADSLLKACSSRKYRPHLMSNNLVLITPFYPEAGFNAGNAMQRNKYIYCLSDAAVVVHSGNPNCSKNGRGGGTWAGALENIKKGWIPLWVKQTEDTQAGNGLIVQEGANWLADNINQVDIQQLSKISHTPIQAMPEDMFSSPQKTDVVAEERPKEPVIESVHLVVPPIQEQEQSALFEMPKTFYQYFLFKVRPLLSEAKQIDELLELLNVNKTQLNVWLKQAVEEQAITKLNKPVSYKWCDASKKQGTLL